MWALKSEIHIQIIKIKYLIIIFFRSFQSFRPQVYDASAKFSSGVLNGNTNRYGDFDQCLSVIAENEDFQGQYCMAYIQPTVSSDFKYFDYLRTLILAMEAYKSNLDDVSIFSVKFV